MFVKLGGSEVSRSMAALENRVAAVETRVDGLAAAVSGEHSDDWDTIRKIVDSGNGAAAFPIGTQFTTPWNGSDIVWDVVDHKTVTNAAGNDVPAMILLMHYVNDTAMQFDAAEALYYTAAGLAAGTYYFSIPTSYDSSYNDYTAGTQTNYVDIQFTIPDGGDIPAGGGFRLTWDIQKKLSTGYISVIDDLDGGGAARGTKYSISNGSEGTFLGTAYAQKGNTIKDSSGAEIGYFNTLERARFGSNCWRDSSLRQYLNTAGTAGEWWKPMTKFDRASGYAATSNGFMAGFDDDFLEAVGKIKVTTATNNYYDEQVAAKSSYVTDDTFWLPSYTELSGKQINNISEGSQFAYYDGAVTADHIKYNSAGTAQGWWERSPNNWTTYSTYYIQNSGVNGSFQAYYSLRIVAACAICRSE